MPAYIVGVYRHPSREAAERADRMCAPSHEAETADTEIHDAPPVILAGLVKGGEIRTREDFSNRAIRGPWVLFAAADGRAVDDSVRGFEAAEARGALPITWYRYEAP